MSGILLLFIGTNYLSLLLAENVQISNSSYIIDNFISKYGISEGIGYDENVINTLTRFENLESGNVSEIHWIRPLKGENNISETLKENLDKVSESSQAPHEVFRAEKDNYYNFSLSDKDGIAKSTLTETFEDGKVSGSEWMIQLKDHVNTSKTSNYFLDEGGDYITFDARAREDAFKITTPAENPYSVLLVAMDNENRALGLCTGSLVTPSWVLTASHCLSIPGNIVKRYKVYAGGNSLDELTGDKSNLPNTSQTRTASSFIPHPKYTDTSYDYDIGLIKVEEPFNLTKTVNLIKLSTQPWTYHSYTHCKLTGFGKVNLKESSVEDHVRKTHDLQVKNPCLCSFKLKIIFGKKTKRYICSKPQEDYGVCLGDSGGGLICDGELKGVAMQMIQMDNMGTCESSGFTMVKCGSRNSLSVFEDTCPFLRWINSHVKLFADADISPKCVVKGGVDTIRQRLPLVALIYVVNLELW